MSWEISVVVASEYTVLASGVLVGKTVLPAAAASPSPAGSSSMVAAGARVRWDFHLDTPVLARSIGFCVAPFVVDLPAGAGAGAGGGNAVPDASAAAASSTAASSSPVETRAKEPTLAWYSVPSRPAGLNKLMESSIAAPAASSSSSSSAASSQGPHKHASTVDLLRTTCASTVPGLVSLYEHLFGSPYPFDALRIAFMEEPASLSMHGGFAGLILLDRDLLYDASLIDQVFTTTEALAYAVAMNWLSHTLWLAHAADWWLLQGIAGWAAATYCASVFGNNFVQHGLYLKAQMVLEEEAELGAWFSKVRADEDFAHEAPDARPWLRTLESHALYHPAVTSMTEIENTVFRAKAHVVFQMLAQKIGGGILGSSGSATVAVSAGAGASAGTGSGPQAPSSGAAVSSGGNVAVRNLIQRLVDEFTYSTAAEDTDSAASARPLSTLRLLEICTELSAAGSGIASLSKAVGSAAASSSAASALSSSELLLTESGQELKAFFDQWIWCNGYPNLDMRFEYKPKNKTTSLRIQQRPMWHRGAAHDEINPQVLRFAGPLKCRIVEVERVNDQERLVPAHMGAGMIGTHHSTAAAGDASAPAPSASSNFTVIEPGSTIEYEFVCSSKVRRNRKRKKLDDASLSLLPIDKLLVRHNDTPLHYARIDPVWSWFALVPSQQDAIHSLWKLNTEKDMLGQLDAIKQVAHAWRNHSNTSSAASAGAGGIEAAALAAKEAASGSAEEKMPDDIFPKSLYSTLQSPVTFWPVRVAAAQALAESATSGPNAAANYKYLQVLVDWFKARYVDGWNPLLHASSGVMAGAASAAMDDDGTGVSRSPADAALAADDLQLRANEFSNISEYMVKQSLPLVLSKIRVQPRNHSLEAGSSSLQPSTPPEVVRFLVWLLRDNDNSENAYSDVIYLGSLLRSLGNLVFPADGSLDVERAQVVQEAQRYLHYDQVVPSYHYTLTQAAMTSLARLERRGQLPSAFTQINFALFAGPTFDRGVRLAAFKSLLTVAPVRPASDRSFTLVLDVLEAESMPGLSHKMMAAWARAVARGSFSSRLLRENCAENTEIMNRIWNIASSATNDPRLAASALALWRCVWGTQTVPASLASPAQRTASNVARGTLQAAVKQAQLEAQLEAQEITARRVARGKHVRATATAAQAVRSGMKAMGNSRGAVRSFGSVCVLVSSRSSFIPRVCVIVESRRSRVSRSCRCCSQA